MKKFLFKKQNYFFFTVFLLLYFTLSYIVSNAFISERIIIDYFDYDDSIYICDSEISSSNYSYYLNDDSEVAKYAYSNIEVDGSIEKVLVINENAREKGLYYFDGTFLFNLESNLFDIKSNIIYSNDKNKSNYYPYFEDVTLDLPILTSEIFIPYILVSDAFFENNNCNLVIISNYDKNKSLFEIYSHGYIFANGNNIKNSINNLIKEKQDMFLSLSFFSLIMLYVAIAILCFIIVKINRKEIEIRFLFFEKKNKIIFSTFFPIFFMGVLSIVFSFTSCLFIFDIRYSDVLWFILLNSILLLGLIYIYTLIYVKIICNKVEMIDD